jgi:hypothetical protein
VIVGERAKVQSRNSDVVVREDDCRGTAESAAESAASSVTAAITITTNNNNNIINKKFKKTTIHRLYNIYLNL